jgi:F-type H+-transporting ATPase subunit b
MAGEAQAAGMPQLDPSSWGNQIFWLLLAVAAIYLILTRIALPRIGAVLAERNGTIANDLAAAEELKLQAQASETAYHKALADARAEAARIVAETRAAIQADLDAALADADAEISARAAASEARISEIRASALEAVVEVAKDTARELVLALGGKSDARAVTSAINARMKGQS